MISENAERTLGRSRAGPLSEWMVAGSGCKACQAEETRVQRKGGRTGRFVPFPSPYRNAVCHTPYCEMRPNCWARLHCTVESKTATRDGQRVFPGCDDQIWGNHSPHSNRIGTHFCRSKAISPKIRYCTRCWRIDLGKGQS